MMREIGSEFWLENLNYNLRINNTPSWLENYGDIIFTSSGRGAISLLLKQISPHYKTALLPAYICDSVISPFIEHGYTCFFYDVEKDLSPIINEEIYKNIGIFLHMGYFGFSTNSSLLDIIQHFKKTSTVIIEDVTHTLFSDFERFKENDFYIGSIRKWFGIPSGGFLASSTKKIKKTELIDELNDNEFTLLRKEALICKRNYIESNNSGLKNIFLKLFSDAEEILDKDFTPYAIDDLSMKIIKSLNSESLVMRRRENFLTLVEGLKKIDYLQPLFSYLGKNECPLFFPILIEHNRDEIRRKLINEQIYCPIHWPIPIEVRKGNNPNAIKIYNSILSIPCDQRYDMNDMKRIINVLSNI